MHKYSSRHVRVSINKLPGHAGAGFSCLRTWIGMPGEKLSSEAKCQNRENCGCTLSKIQGAIHAMMYDGRPTRMRS